MRHGSEPRLGFAFTPRDSAELRRRIVHDLVRITEAARASDPHLHALVLTGGFSRGEGSALEDLPLNDYDLVAIRRRPGPGQHARTSAALSRELGIEVDILPVWRSRLPYVSHKLFWLDVRLGGQVIAGDAHALELLPDMTPSSLGPREVARLLGNRAAGLLLAIPAPDAEADTDLRDLQATKAILAALDATLLARGEYGAFIEERLALAADHPEHALFARAVAWKLDPTTPVPDTWWDDARHALLAAVDATNARAASDGLEERVFHLLRAGRFTRGPSQAVRLAAWELLATSHWPEGAPGGRDEQARARRAFFTARARTLQ